MAYPTYAARAPFMVGHLAPVARERDPRREHVLRFRTRARSALEDGERTGRVGHAAVHRADPTPEFGTARNGLSESMPFERRSAARRRARRRRAIAGTPARRRGVARSASASAGGPPRCRPRARPVRSGAAARAPRRNRARVTGRTQCARGPRPRDPGDRAHVEEHVAESEPGPRPVGRQADRRLPVLDRSRTGERAGKPAPTRAIRMARSRTPSRSRSDQARAFADCQGSSPAQSAASA